MLPGAMVVGACDSLLSLSTRAERVFCLTGCDVSHPAPNIKDRPSLASVVTSYNSTATKYRVYLDCQAPRQEIIDRIAAMLHVCTDSALLRTILILLFSMR